ncbi:MAG: enoyl-CoA hydratase/isomerase family protein [Acidobacteria bacterium]|nr:enoyl-CoA hydratase/isomerase family protein [Acidobacteriota bacterium]
MLYKKILHEQEGFIARLVLNRPETLNAMDLEMQEELLRALLAISKDPAIRVIVLKGAGRAFSSGGDIQAMKESLGADIYQIMKDWIQRMHLLEMQIRTIRKPVIASVHGIASGSAFNLALSCDLVIAAEDVRFAQSFVSLGLTSDGTYFLTRVVGTLKAAELMFLGEEIHAAEARQLGIVNRVVPLQELESETRRLAMRLGSGPTEALGRIKSLINKSFFQTLDKHLQEESELIAETARTRDFQEGVMAFLEKRAPQFKGE